MSRWAIGIDLGGTAIKAAVVGAEMGILTDRTNPTNTAMGPEGIVFQLSEIIADLYRSAAVTLDPADFAGVGLGAPGAVDVELGTLSYPPNLPGWGVFALREELLQCLVERENLSISVILENDANAAAYG